MNFPAWHAQLGALHPIGHIGEISNVIEAVCIWIRQVCDGRKLDGGPYSILIATLYAPGGTFRTSQADAAMGDVEGRAESGKTRFE